MTAEYRESERDKHAVELVPEQPTFPDERAKFEAWARTSDGNCNGWDLRRHPHGHYKEQLVARDWEVWQARAALAQSQVHIDWPTNHSRSHEAMARPSCVSRDGCLVGETSCAAAGYCLRPEVEAKFLGAAPVAQEPAPAVAWGESVAWVEEAMRLHGDATIIWQDYVKEDDNKTAAKIGDKGLDADAALRAHLLTAGAKS